MSDRPPEYEWTLALHQTPHYDVNIQDNLRIGSFVYLSHKTKGSRTHYNVARLEERQRDEDDEAMESIVVRCRLFYPLFESPPNQTNPTPPSHSFRPITHGPGSENTELYESADLCWLKFMSKTSGPQCIHPSFVFTPKELEHPKNAWAASIFNVYIVRYWENKDCDKRELVPLPDDAHMGFINDHPKFKPKPNTFKPQRCLHEAIWNGLYTIRKSIHKLLNKRSGQGSDREVVSLNIGCVAMESIQFISQVANTLITLNTHPISLSESFFHLDSSLSRSKVRILIHAHACEPLHSS